MVTVGSPNKKMDQRLPNPGRLVSFLLFTRTRILPDRRSCLSISAEHTINSTTTPSGGSERLESPLRNRRVRENQDTFCPSLPGSPLWHSACFSRSTWSCNLSGTGLHDQLRAERPELWSCTLLNGPESHVHEPPRARHLQHVLYRAESEQALQVPQPKQDGRDRIPSQQPRALVSS
jgi:hypothetical protein